MSKKKLIPELRFPEFQKSEGWTLTTIGELGSFYYGKSAPKWSLSEDAPTPCVRYGELYTKFGTVIKGIFSRTNIDPSGLRFSKGGEILIPRVGEDPYEFSKCSYLPFPNVAIGEMISVYETEEDSIFYAYYFNTLKRQFAKVVEGQNVKNLYYINLEPIAVGKPKELAEQQKIASCLSSLDEIITAHKDRLQALKDHKKGLMQNLFPQKGQKVPNYRFPEFENDGEWVENELQTHCHSISSGKDKNQDDGNFDLYGSTGIIGKSVNGSYQGDYILVARVGANAGLLNRVKGQFGVTDNTLVVNLKDPEIIGFIFYSLDKIDLNKLVFGSGQPLVTGKQLKELYIPIPQNPKEQQKIASCLSATDGLITAQKEQIEELQQHKKGLMQGLFPKVSEL